MSLPPLDALERFSGLVAGRRRTPPPPPAPAIPGGARDVLEALLLDALSRPPCHIAFSGGRDSSAVLAVAVAVARRHGLPMPIPLTAEYDDPATKETDWQELVIAHLGLQDVWERFHVTDELDVLGPFAVNALQRHGQFWPPNAHSMYNFTGRIRGGTMVTGGGGDEVLTHWRWGRAPVRETLAMRPVKRAVKWTAFYAIPPTVRQRLQPPRVTIMLPWLTPAATQELMGRFKRPRTATWGADVEIYLDGRYWELVRSALDTFAADDDVRLVEPFYDPRFARALVAEAPRGGFPDRTTAFRTLFSDVLPDEVLARTTKAGFNAVGWGPQARAFAESWDGTGLDPDVVVPEAVQAAWLEEVPDVRCVGPLYAAWLARAGASAS